MTRDSPLGEAQPGEIVVVEKPSGRIYGGIFSPRTATDSRKHVSATTGASIELGQFEIERRRSQVRQRVTYWPITAFPVLAALVILWPIWAGRYEGPLGVLGGVAGLAGAIAGFWFGAGKPKEGRSSSGRIGSGSILSDQGLRIGSSHGCGLLAVHGERDAESRGGGDSTGPVLLPDLRC